MTNRERAFAKIGFEYSEGIDYADRVIIPHTGREIRRSDNGWDAQPWNDNYWLTFADLLDAATFATPPQFGGPENPSQFAKERAIVSRF